MEMDVLPELPDSLALPRGFTVVSCV
jgi:hypothetical protein